MRRAIAKQLQMMTLENKSDGEEVAFAAILRLASLAGLLRMDKPRFKRAD
ncbi:MAG: hypothetical protein AB1813_03185 [Verrucomicrobiota bacterium]